MKTKTTLSLLAALLFSFGLSAKITVTSPNGGETWMVGSNQTITWTVSGISLSAVPINYSTDGGSSWIVVIASTANSGSYAWTIPNTPSTKCLVRVGQGNEIDQSDATFVISLSTGISSARIGSVADVYPSPAKGTLFIKANGDVLSSVELFDVTGRKVKRVGAELLAAETNTIDISALPAGVYFVIVRSNEGTQTKKISILQ